MASEALTHGSLPRVQWGPVIAGVLCAVAAQIVLGLFGVAFGLAAVPAGRSVGILAAIWSLATPIVASFIGAHVAVRNAADRHDAGAYLHGALVWCIGLIAGALFITGSIASGAMTAGTAASGNIGARVLERHDTPTNRARAQTATEESARSAAEGTGAAGVAALLGLGGALLGAGLGKRVVLGRGIRRGSFRRDEYRGDMGVETGVAYGGSGGTVTTRPPTRPATGMPGTTLPDAPDPNLHHH